MRQTVSLPDRSSFRECIQLSDWVTKMAALCALVLLPVPAVAAPTYTVSFDDPGGNFAAYYSEITSNLLAAGADWNRFLGGQPVTIDLQIGFDPSIGTANAANATNAVVGMNGQYSVLAQGVPFKLLTGKDLNGPLADARINIGSGYLANDLWFDPNPLARLSPVPVGKTDAVSVFIHELGHIFGMSGFLNGSGLPSTFNISTFDEHVISVAGDPFFDGSRAEAIYGGLVPLTFGNYPHLGNKPPRLGADLLGDLMNGVEFVTGSRYDISALDLAILADSGLPLIDSLPEPPPLLLLLPGLALLSSAHLIGRHIGGFVGKTDAKA